MGKAPSVRQIAELAHVSVTTVSRVINGQSGVDEATRALVWKTIHEVGYDVVRHPDALSGILVFAPMASFHNNTYWCLVMSGILEEASLLSIPVMFSTAMTKDEARSEIRSFASREGLLGVILAGFPMNASVSDWVPEHLDVASVSILMDAPGHLVNADMYTAFFDATRQLQAMGHRRIALAISALAYWSPHQRLQGYLDACAEAGLAPVVERISVTEKASAWLRDALASPQPPTAVIGGTSGISKHLFAELLNLKIDLPGALSFLGTSHGVPFEQHLYDSIEQPTFELGVQAVRTLRQVVARPGRPAINEPLSVRQTSAGTIGPLPV